MKPADDREEVLFREALKRAKGPEREAYLDQACAGNAALRSRLEDLLRAHESLDSFLEPPVAAPSGATGLQERAPQEAPGTLIGRYKILERIGEGGFGVVYVAEQREPVKRRVALKIIKLGMDTRQVVARFEAERQALALMDHPNIAKVLDAGATDTGRPYFVMELVKGISITKYCDQEKLAMRQRLELFIQICHAIQHAHQKGIIHRDIKPSNILVTLHDGVPVPKVIDFGIAKATQQELTEKTVYTQFQQFIGTPAYMSPEQAELSGLDIDMRSDIYSLGVLLYELLTGSTPFDTEELLQSGLDEMRKIIREREPIRPSTRLTREWSAKRGGEAGSSKGKGQKSAVDSDLDWIVMKCLEKDRTRRYETANGLAHDLLRYLNNEPVMARPPSKLYRFQKLVRRNKLAFAAVAGVTCALLLGVVMSLWQAVRATRAEALAKQRLADSEAISKFLTEVFQSPDPARDGRTITVAETLGTAAKKLETDLVDQPARRAKLEATLGWTYFMLGLNREAIALQEKVRDYYLAASGPEHLDTLAAMGVLASAYERAGRLDECLRLREEVLPLRRKVSGPENPDTLVAMYLLASSYDKAGRHGEAIKLSGEALALCRKVLGPEHPSTLWAMFYLSKSYSSVGRWGEALKLAEEELALDRKTGGPENPYTFWAMYNLAYIYDKMGRPNEAIKLQEELLTLERKVLGPEHPDTIFAMRNLSGFYYNAGRRNEALKLREEGLALRRKVFGPEHLNTLWEMHDLATSYDEAGFRDEALKLREELLTFRRRISGPEHPATLEAMYKLANSLDAAGRRNEALKLREEVLALRRKVLGPEHPDTLRTLNEIARTLATSDAPEIRNGTNAVRLAEEAVAASGRTNATFLDTLAAAYAETHQFDKAVSAQNEAIALLGNEEQKSDYRSRLRLYEDKTPYRQPTNNPVK